MLNIYQIWAEECEVATVIKAEMGADKALNYFIGEKLMYFLAAAETDLISERKLPPCYRNQDDVRASANGGVS